VRRIPTQPIKVRHLVVRGRYQHHVWRKIGLLREKLLGSLIEVGRRSRIDEQHRRFLRREIRRIFDEVVNLFLAVGTLVSRVSTKHNQHQGASMLLL
jgi:hypothetical protein